MEIVKFVSSVDKEASNTPIIQEPLNKRYRQKFSADDKELFLRILRDHIHVIERKEGDVMTLKRKHAAWSTVLQTYNAGASSERDLHQLRLLWKRMKKGAVAPVLKEDNFTPEEFTVMVNPFDVNSMNGNMFEVLKSSCTPTPSPDSSDCYDFSKTDDDDEVKPLQINLQPESLNQNSIPEKGDNEIKEGNSKESKMQTPIRWFVNPLRGKEAAKEGLIKKHPSAYEGCLLRMAEKEHLQKMNLLKLRKQNEVLREELLQLKIKTQLMKQERVRQDVSNHETQKGNV